MKAIHLLTFTCVLLLSACRGSEGDSHASHADGHEGHAETAEPAKGPHRGRLLEDGDLTIELAIFEDGVPPEYHAWPTSGSKPIALEDVNLVVELSRLGGKTDRFTFKPEADYLRGDGVVHEPHSFSVKVWAAYKGKTSTWAYDSFEGRTTIPAKIAEAAGVRTDKAGPATLTETLALYGRLVADPERRREVRARYPGLIRSVKKSLGDPVQAGEVLATIESNESLREYALTAPLAGIVTARDANTGEQSGERTLFTVTDTGAVVAELSVFPRHRERVKPGATVRLRIADSDATAPGTIHRMESQAGANQSVVARVPIRGAGPAFVPGSFVTGDVAVTTREVPLAVKTAGLQPFRDFTVVYAQVGETYEVRMLELGKEYGEWVEVLGGIDAGETYVSGGSYVIKADVEKSGASHDH
ncbi:MAG: efflux RND transporter periplasmic adaptor subunit [Panacagrimonas sp.]